MEEYERDHKLDKNNLDVEWEKQARLYMKWARRCAKAIKERIQVEERLRLLRGKNKGRLEEVRAEVDAKVRLNPELYFKKEGKLTETAITGVVAQSKEYKEEYARGVKEVSEVFKEFAEAVESEHIMEGAKTAMTHKRAAIDGETRLWLGGYFAEVRVPAEAKDKVEEEARVLHKTGLGENPRLAKRKRKLVNA